MKQYVFEITLDEGYDEFWESIDQENDVEEVTNLVQSILSEYGFYEGDNCQIVLKETLDDRQYRMF